MHGGCGILRNEAPWLVFIRNCPDQDIPPICKVSPPPQPHRPHRLVKCDVAMHSAMHDPLLGKNSNGISQLLTKIIQKCKFYTSRSKSTEKGAD